MEAYSVDQVQLPGVAGKVVKRVGVGVVVEREGGLDGQVDNHETLGTQLVRQDLDGVADEETGPREGVEEAKQPDEEDHGVVGAGRAVLLVQAGRQGPEDEGHEHAARGGEEDGSATEAVDLHGERQGGDEGETGLAGGEAEAGGGALDAGVGVEDVCVV